MSDSLESLPLDDLVKRINETASHSAAHAEAVAELTRRLARERRTATINSIGAVVLTVISLTYAIASLLMWWND